MSDLAIRAEGLSKRYQLGKYIRHYDTLGDSMARAVTAPMRWISERKNRQERPAEPSETEMWAIRDVTFELKRGEVIGVIGRNGAGKSTLLKVLARITEPTSGFAEIRGRVGSLLEVGTGFHGELTGRENIFLNGAILGMGKSEVARKFDEMTAFAGIDRFIDTPVKHYSSGMYMRLAFTVAAHLEPEILLCDEVLAVGDAAFQKKCIGKIGSIAREGRTVLFVSHNLSAVKELCTSGLVLHHGRLNFQGPVAQALGHYSQSMHEPDDTQAHSTRWQYVNINEHQQTLSHEVASDEPIRAEAQLDVAVDYLDAKVFFIVEDAMGTTVLHRRADFANYARVEKGSFHVSLTVPPLWLGPGVFTAYFKVVTEDVYSHRQRFMSDRVIFEIPGSREDLGKALLSPPCDFEIKTVTPRVLSAAHH